MRGRVNYGERTFVKRGARFIVSTASLPQLYPCGIGCPVGKRIIRVAFDEDVQHRLLTRNYHARDFSNVSPKF